MPKITNSGTSSPASNPAAEFNALWEQHEVAERHRTRKRIMHRAVGLIELDCEVLATPDAGQALVLLGAAPGLRPDDQLHLIAMAATAR